MYIYILILCKQVNEEVRKRRVVSRTQYLSQFFALEGDAFPPVCWSWSPVLWEIKLNILTYLSCPSINRTRSFTMYLMVTYKTTRSNYF